MCLVRHRQTQLDASMHHLPLTQSGFNPETGDSSDQDAEPIRYAHHTQRKLFGLGVVLKVLGDANVRVNIRGSAEETLPEDEGKDQVYARDRDGCLCGGKERL